MIDHAQLHIDSASLQDLPVDWPAQLERGLLENYLVGYDADLDEVHIWFTTNRDLEVLVPLSQLIDIAIEDEGRNLIGFVIRKFAQIAINVAPELGQLVTTVERDGELRLPSDIPMQPMSRLSATVAPLVLDRAIKHVAHLLAA